MHRRVLLFDIITYVRTTISYYTTCSRKFQLFFVFVSFNTLCSTFDENLYFNLGSLGKFKVLKFPLSIDKKKTHTDYYYIVDVYNRSYTVLINLYK